jgi:hypothetical protein
VIFNVENGDYGFASEAERGEREKERDRERKVVFLSAHINHLVNLPQCK